MKKYIVRCYYHTMVETEVEAECKEDAIDIAGDYLEGEDFKNQIYDNLVTDAEPDAEEIE